ncbi:replication initiation protein [Variovorax ginsengisoli]|nr:replication initiation protein [Variovorax ginsengisoli]
MLLKKPVQSLVMIPKIGKLTTTARKLFNVILQTSQQQIAELSKNGAVDLGGHMYSARLSDLLEPIQQGSSNLRALGKTYFREMMQTTIEWEAPDSKKSGIVWDISHLLSAARLEYVDKEGNPGSSTNSHLVAKWGLPAPLYNALKHPELYAQVNIRQIAKLGSYEAVALYEICTRYRSNFDGLTNKSEPLWWVRALTNKQPAIDPITQAPKYRPWVKFKDDKLKDAIAEISQLTDLEIELIEEREGKKIAFVQFRVRRKAESQGDTTPVVSTSIAELSLKCGIALQDISKLLRVGIGEGPLKIALLKLESRMAREDLEPIGSKLSYLNTVIAETQKYVAIDIPVPPSVETPGPVERLAVVTPPVAPISYKDRRRAEIKADFTKLSKEEQQPYALAASDLLKAAGLMQPSVARAIFSQDWLKNGLLLSKMIEAYAVATHGPDWAAEPVES